MQYGDTKSYKFKLDRERLDWLTGLTNRSNGQTQFLFQLVGGDFERLKKLEMKLKNCLCCYCPGSVDDVELVMKMEDKCNLLTI